MKYKNKGFKISCDGAASTGKSTGARLISKKYNLKFLSSGLLYRYASYLLIKNKPKNKITFLKKKFDKLNYKRLEKIHLHKQKISEVSAKIAKINKVRKILKKYQLTFAKKYKNCCIELKVSEKNIKESSNKHVRQCINYSIKSRKPVILIYLIFKKKKQKFNKYFSKAKFFLINQKNLAVFE